MDTSTPVLILRFHHGSLAIARSLGRLGIHVYGVDADRDNISLGSRYVRDRFIWDLGAADPGDSIDFLLDVGRKIGRPTLLIPTSDHTAELVADHADALEGPFLFPRVPPELVRALSNKKELYFLARGLGIPTPETVFPQHRADVEAFASGAQFPVLLKAADGLRMEARTGQKMVIVESAEEMLRQYDRLEDPENPDLMIQEYIPGDDDTIWMFEGYFDRHSECVSGITGRKIRQHPVHRGATSLGILLENETVDRMTRTFMKEIGYRGILDIGYRYDARDGQYKLLDPNPRIGSTFRLFVDENGTDVARLLYRDMTGQPLTAADPRWGRRWLIEDQDFFSCIDYAREGTLSLRGWVRSLRGVEETAWFALDDLGPFLRTMAGVFRRLAAAVWKRLPGSGPSGRSNVTERATDEAADQDTAGDADLPHGGVSAHAEGTRGDHVVPPRGRQSEGEHHQLHVR